MKRLLSLAVCTTLAACSTLNSQSTFSQESLVSVDDIILLAQSNISDETIMSFLSYRQVDFNLDVEEILRLRAAGVSEDIIQYLLEQDATTIASVPAYVAPTRYRTAYPSYYYGSTVVGLTMYPLGWYNHNYFGFGHSSIYRYPLYFGGGHSIGHSVSITHGQGRTPVHVFGIHGGKNLVSHTGLNLGHSGGRSRGHSVGHSSGHSRGHSGGHSRGHSRGHSGGHGGGHGGGH